MATFDPDGLLGKDVSVMNDGSYDMESLKAAESSIEDGNANSSEFEEVDPLHIVVIPNRAIHHTDEYEARIVIIEYDAFDNIIGVELL